MTRLPAVALSTPELQARLKPVLNKGTNMTIAAEGFRSAEEFATVAHAAQEHRGAVHGAQAPRADGRQVAREGDSRVEA